jgi:hypothetical protein
LAGIAGAGRNFFAVSVAAGTRKKFGTACIRGHSVDPATSKLAKVELSVRLKMISFDLKLLRADA